MTRITLPACRAPYPGGSRRVLVSVPSPSRAAFPESQAGRHPRRHLRGLLRLHSRYGPLDRSAAQRRPLSQGFDRAGYPAGPLASYQTKPTTLWVEPSSTGDARRLGALRNPGFCNRAADVNPSRSLLYHAAGLVLLSVVGAGPPHDAVRWSGRADLRHVVRRGLADHSRICGFVRSMRPRDGTWLPDGLRACGRFRPRSRSRRPSEKSCHRPTCGASPPRACGRVPPWPSSCHAGWRPAVPKP
jgi:hypothetical protein